MYPVYAPEFQAYNLSIIPSLFYSVCSYEQFFSLSSVRSYSFKHRMIFVHINYIKFLYRTKTLWKYLTKRYILYNYRGSFTINIF